MHPWGPAYFASMVAAVAEAEAEVLGSDDAEDTVGAVHVVELVEATITTRVSAPTAKLTAILQMHAETRNALRREQTAEKTAEETTSACATSAGSQATSKSIASPTNV